MPNNNKFSPGCNCCTPVNPCTCIGSIPTTLNVVDSHYGAFTIIGPTTWTKTINVSVTNGITIANCSGTHAISSFSGQLQYSMFCYSGSLFLSIVFSVCLISSTMKSYMSDILGLNDDGPDTSILSIANPSCPNLDITFSVLPYVGRFAGYTYQSNIYVSGGTVRVFV